MSLRRSPRLNKTTEAVTHISIPDTKLDQKSSRKPKLNPFTYKGLFDRFNLPYTLLSPSAVHEHLPEDMVVDYRHAVFQFGKMLETRFDRDTSRKLMEYHNIPHTYKTLADIPEKPQQTPLPDWGLTPIRPFEKSCASVGLEPYIHNISDALMSPASTNGIVRQIRYLTNLQDTISENLPGRFAEKTNILLQNAFDIFRLNYANVQYIRDHARYAEVSYAKAYELLWEIGYKHREHFLDCNITLVLKVIYSLRSYMRLYEALYPNK